MCHLIWGMLISLVLIEAPVLPALNLELFYECLGEIEGDSVPDANFKDWFFPIPSLISEASIKFSSSI